MRWKKETAVVSVFNRLDTRLDAGENSVYILSSKKERRAADTLDSVATTPHGEIVINLPAEIQTRLGLPNNLPRDAISAFDSRADDGAAGASDAAAADDTEETGSGCPPRFCTRQRYKNRITKILCAWHGGWPGYKGEGREWRGG